MGNTEAYGFQCDINGKYWCWDCGGPDYAEYHGKGIGEDYRVKDGITAFPERPEECEECGNRQYKHVRNRPDDDLTYRGFEDKSLNEEGSWKCRSCSHKHFKKDLAEDSSDEGGAE